MEKFIDFVDFSEKMSATGPVYCLKTFGNYFEIKITVHSIVNHTVSLKYQTSESKRVESKMFDDLGQCLDFIEEFMATYWVKKIKGEKPTVIEQKVGQPF